MRWILLIILFPVSSLFAIDDAALDEIARTVPAAQSRTMETLVVYFQSKSTGERDLARMIFTWITKEVAYDQNGFNSGSYGDTSSNGVWKRRKSVCEGFAELYQRLCSMAGLDCRTIQGFAKGYGYKAGQKMRDTNHAWNAIRVNGRWALMDVTWAEGYAISSGSGISSRKEFNPFWFDTDPAAFVFSHLPEDKSAEFQNLPNLLSMDEYFEMPYLHYTSFSTPDKNALMLENARNRMMEKFVTIHPSKNAPKMIEYPLEGELSKGKSYQFQFKGSGIHAIGMYDGGNWNYFKAYMDSWDFEYTAQGKMLQVVLIYNVEMTKTSVLMSYEVN